MRSLSDQLTQYADYHRDPRNIATHFVGIPMIVVAVAMLLSRPVFGEWAGVALSPALAVVGLTTLYYLRLDVRYGIVMGGLLALSLAAGQWAAAQATGTWLGWGLGLFVVGWVIQFVGHIFEGRKPAFVDDLVGLVIGPLFVTAEAGFLLGLRRPLRDEIHTRLGALPHPARRAPAAA